MQDFPWTALATLLALLLYMFMIMGVGGARRKYKVAGPATTGDPNFERHFRVQMNTLESLPLFLPALWLFAFTWDDIYAAALGGVWIIGRLLYWRGYVSAGGSRSLGFQIQGLAISILVLGALYRVVQTLLATAQL
jgi:glutathione S-transferase